MKIEGNTNLQMEHSLTPILGNFQPLIISIYTAVETHTLLKRRPVIINTVIAIILPTIAQNIFKIYKVVDNPEEYMLQLPQIGLHKLSESQKKSSRHLEVQL